MKEKEEEIKAIFENLTEENKDIINMVAKGMELAQNNERSNKND